MNNLGFWVVVYVVAGVVGVPVLFSLLDDPMDYEGFFEDFLGSALIGVPIILFVVGVCVWQSVRRSFRRRPTPGGTE